MLNVWNKNRHDHEQEISTGRVQVLDMLADQAKDVADLVAKTDGIVFYLWPHDAKLPKVPPDQIEGARSFKNPLTPTAEMVEEGKALSTGKRSAYDQRAELLPGHCLAQPSSWPSAAVNLAGE